MLLEGPHKNKCGILSLKQFTAETLEIKRVT